MLRCSKNNIYLKGVKNECQKTILYTYGSTVNSKYVALVFLPDLIPAHYNIKNEIDRWGRKYEILIILIIIILLGKFLLFMRK